MWGGDNYEEGKKDGQIDRWREGETESEGWKRSFYRDGKEQNKTTSLQLC